MSIMNLNPLLSGLIFDESWVEDCASRCCEIIISEGAHSHENVEVALLRENMIESIKMRVASLALNE
jgi:hypothetical protein